MIPLMRLEYLEDLESQSPRVLLAYGNDPRDATVLRRAVEQLAASSEAHDVRIDTLPEFQPVDGCSLTASVGSVDSGVEQLDGSDRAFRCVLRPATWRRVSGLLEPFEKTEEPARSPYLAGLRTGARFQFLSETGPVEWIVSTERSW
jgi:hypothetical protein